MHLKTKIFPKAPIVFEDDIDEEEVLKRHRDKINRLPSKKSELPTIQEKKKILLLMTLIKCILVMLMVLINCFLIQRNI